MSKYAVMELNIPNNAKSTWMSLKRIIDYRNFISIYIDINNKYRFSNPFYDSREKPKNNEKKRQQTENSNFHVIKN